MNNAPQQVTALFRYAGVVDFTKGFDPEKAPKGHLLIAPPGNEYFSSEGFASRGVRLLYVPVQPKKGVIGLISRLVS